MFRPLIAGIYVQQRKSHCNKTHLNILNHSCGCTKPHVNWIKVINAVVIGHIFDMRKATKQQLQPDKHQVKHLGKNWQEEARIWQSSLDEKMTDHCMDFIAMQKWDTRVFLIISTSNISYLSSYLLTRLSRMATIVTVHNRKIITITSTNQYSV